MCELTESERMNQTILKRPFDFCIGNDTLHMLIFFFKIASLIVITNAAYSLAIENT